MRSTRIKRSKKNRKDYNHKIKAIVLISSLFFTIILNSFQSFILESSAAVNDDGYIGIDVAWSRTKEVNSPNGKYVDATNNSGYFWNNYMDNGTRYKCLNKNENNDTGVLRTNRLLKGTGKVLLDYDTLLGNEGILTPTETNNVWDGKSGLGRYFTKYSVDPAVNAPDYPDYATWTHSGAWDGEQDQWRVFRGTFTDSNLGIKDSTGKYDPSKRVYVGVKNKDPQLILPVNDYVIILVDGQVTKMNFSTEPVTEAAGNKDNMSFLTKDFAGNKSIQKVEFQPLYFNRDWSTQNQNYKCTDPSHAANSIHTDTWHAHLNDKVTQNDGGNLRLGDITEYLNPNITNHKIEIIGGDFCEGGGMSKLQLYMTEEPETLVEKQGYVIENNQEKLLIDNDPSANIYFGDTVYYKFKITNKKNMNLPKASIVFEDESLGIKISKEGIFSKDKTSGQYTKVSSQNLIVKKGNGIPITGENGLSTLASLNANESLEVSCIDYFNHKITDMDVESGIFKNTVVGTVGYFNGSLTLSHEDTFTVIPKYPSLSETKMEKSVQKVMRNNIAIYPKGEVDKVPDLIPGDIVTFKITMSNTGTRPTGLLTLEDILKGESYTKNEWIFMNGTNVFNPIKFRLNAGETKSITTDLEVQTPIKGKIGDYNPINTAYLKLGDQVIKSELKLSLERPKLKIVKKLAEGSLDESDKSKTFTISIKGDDNTTFNLEATIDKEYIIDNLEYGVKYTITEVVPMNYQDIGSIEVLMDSVKNNSVFYIENKKINEEHFYDDDTKINTFLYKVE